MEGPQDKRVGNYCTYLITNYLSIYLFLLW